jgi:Transposase, Mutator family
VILWKTFHSASEGDTTVTAPSSIDPARFLHDQLASASPDLLRSMLTTFINTLMSAEADAVCGAPYGMPSADRVNVRNGYRHRDFDTRTGTLDVAIPKLRSGSYFPDWLLERRRRAEAADVGGGHVLPARGIHTADGKAGGVPGDHEAVPVAGQRDGPGPR